MPQALFLFLGSGYKMAVGEVYILGERLRIAQGCLNPGMAQEPLHLLQRHPALKGERCGSVPENVWRNMTVNSAALHNLLDFVLHRLDGQTVVRCTAADEQRGGIVLPGIQICTQGDLRFGIEVGSPAFATFAALNMDRVILPIDV